MITRGSFTGPVAAAAQDLPAPFDAPGGLAGGVPAFAETGVARPDWMPTPDGGA